MTKTLSMVSQKINNLHANEGFVLFLASKLITCLIDGLTSKRKSQSIAYLLNGSEHIYWILNIDNEVHSIWVIWTNNLQESKGHARVVQGRGMPWSGFIGVALPTALTRATLVKGI